MEAQTKQISTVSEIIRYQAIQAYSNFVNGWARRKHSSIRRFYITAASIYDAHLIIEMALNKKFMSVK